MGDPREVTPPFIREALLASVEAVSSYPRATGLPELRDGDRRLDRRGASASTSTRRPRSCRRSARRRRSSRSRRSRSARSGSSRSPSPAIPVYERGALFAGGAVVDRAAARGERLAARPRRVRRVGRDRALLGLLPEQPDRRRRAALVLRGARRARARARLPALLRRGVLGAVVRRAAGLGAAGRRPDERRRLQHALEALVDDRLPLGLRLRAARRSPMRCARSARPSARRRRSSCSARRSRPGRTRRTSRTCATLYRRKRETLLPALEAAGLRLAGSTATFYLWLDVGGPSEAFARRLLEHGIVVAPGSFFGAGRRGLRPLRARADAGGVRARGGDPREVL